MSFLSDKMMTSHITTQEHCNDIKTFSALLALCAWDESTGTDGFPSQRAIYIWFVVSLNKQSSCRRFETPWHLCDVTVLIWTQKSEESRILSHDCNLRKLPIVSFGFPRIGHCCFLKKLNHIHIWLAWLQKNWKHLSVLLSKHQCDIDMSCILSGIVLMICLGKLS